MTHMTEPTFTRWADYVELLAYVAGHEMVAAGMVVNTAYLQAYVQMFLPRLRGMVNTAMKRAIQTHGGTATQRQVKDELDMDISLSLTSRRRR